MGGIGFDPPNLINVHVCILMFVSDIMDLGLFSLVSLHVQVEVAHEAGLLKLDVHC